MHLGWGELVALEKNGQSTVSRRVKKFSGIEVARMSSTAGLAASSTEDTICVVPGTEASVGVNSM